MTQASLPTILLPDAILPDSRTPGGLPGHGVAVQGNRILDVGRREELVERYPQAFTKVLRGAVLMPGLVNAHQHGRLVSSLQLGLEDDYLESFMVKSRNRLFLDPELNARLVCASFLAGGVTTAVQTNTPLGTGDYEREIRSMISAYDGAGIRAAVAVGCMDRGHVVYRDDLEKAFVAGLPREVGVLATRPARPIYAGNSANTIALSKALLQDYGRHPLISIGYGPAGPQWASDDLLRAIATHASEDGLFVHFHGLESIAQCVAVAKIYPEGFLARLKELGLANSRTSIGHAVWMTDQDARIAAERGITFVRNPGSNLRLRNGSAPFCTYKHMGVPLAIGTDNLGLGDEEDMFAEIRLAGALARSPFFDSAPPPSSAELFEMATEGGARMLGMTDVGKIAIGWKADFAALSLEAVRGIWMSARIPLLDQIVQRAKAGHVMMTMVDGRVLYENGTHHTVDVGSTAAQVRDFLDRQARSIASEQVLQLASKVEDFYTAQTRVEELPDHWRPLALDPRRRF